MRLLFYIAICWLLTGCRDSDIRTEGINSENEFEKTFSVRTWPVPADFMEHLLIGPPLTKEEIEEHENWVEEHGEGGFGCKFIFPLPDMFETRYDIHFPTETTVEFSPNRGELKVKNTKARLDQIDELILSLGPMEQFSLDESLFHAKQSLVLNGRKFPTELARIQWHVSSEVMDEFFRREDEFPRYEEDPFEEDPFATSEEDVQGLERKPAHTRPLAELFNESGIAVPPGASASYDRNTETLTSINDEGNTFIIEHIFLDLALSMSRQKLGIAPPDSQR